MRLALLAVLFVASTQAGAQRPGHECCYISATDRNAESGVVIRFFKIRDNPLPAVDNLWCNKWLECTGDRETAAQGQDPVERMRKLKALLDQGLITPREYEAKRTEILKGL